MEDKSNAKTQKKKKLNGCLCVCSHHVFKQVFKNRKSFFQFSHDFSSEHLPTPLDMHRCLSEIPTVKTFFNRISLL